MSYPETDCLLRSDKSFRLKLQTDHHISISPLEVLSIDMIQAFPLDPMHLIYLGVVKKLLIFWTKSKKHFSCKLDARKIDKISSNLQKAALNKPSEISRKIRTLNVLPYWKATEFRSFVLYTGPIVLKDILPNEVYNNFMNLHCAVTICGCEYHVKNGLVTRAEEFFENFIQEFKTIYGNGSVSYNIQNLCHVCDDVRRLGSFEKFSAFPFKTLLKDIKGLLQSGNKPLQQVADRIKSKT